MTFDDLCLFLAVCEAGSLSQASVRLGVAQPGLSRTIRRLETAFGGPLFDRTGRGMAINQAGKQVEAFARTCLANLETVTATVQRTVPQQRLSISIPLNTGRFLVPAVLRCFAAAVPDVRVDVFEERSDIAVQSLTDGVLDLAIYYEPPRHPSLRAETLATEKMYLIGRPEVIGSATTAVKLKAVATMPLLLPKKTLAFRRLIDRAFAACGVEPTIARNVEISQAMIALAAEGDGVAIMPYSNIGQEVARAEIAARPITSPVIDRRIALAVGRDLDPALVRLALPLMRKAAKTVMKEARWQLPK